MVDPTLAVVAWLKTSAPLAALIGSNIFSPYLTEGFSAMKGQKAVVVRCRGGASHPEIPPLIEPSVAIEAWAMEAPDAKAIYAVIHDLMHGATSIDLGANGFVILSQEEVHGQDVLDPETRWAAVIAYYRLWLRPQVS